MKYVLKGALAVLMAVLVGALAPAQVLAIKKKRKNAVTA